MARALGLPWTGAARAHVLRRAVVHWNTSVPALEDADDRWLVEARIDWQGEHLFHRRHDLTDGPILVRQGPSQNLGVGRREARFLRMHGGIYVELQSEQPLAREYCRDLTPEQAIEE